ncbi:MAG: uracil-DNA glycosylase family protein [Pseudomonadota bacterium]
MTRRDQMLEALGIGPQWVLRGRMPAAPTKQDAVHPAHPVTLAHSVSALEVEQIEVVGFAENGKHTDNAIAGMNWQTLQAAVSNCTRCNLCESRTRTVFGTGDVKAKWLFVGEGPGRNEDRQGEPFVGPAGKLLDNMLVAMTLRRDRNAFIANVVKCRPTDANGKDRAPSVQESMACKPYLLRQIALIQPTIMVALGKTAAVALLECAPTIAVSKLRGVVHRYGELPLVVTYHPAYLLRALVDKRKAWEDLCLAMDTYSSAA